jgi:beta-glucosidase
VKQSTISVAVAVCFLVVSSLTGSAQNRKKPVVPAGPPLPWMNTSLSPDERADLAVKELTLDEKIQLVHGIGWGSNAGSAAALAKSSDMAIVFVDQYMSEGSDHYDLALPGKQDDLVTTVAAANTHTVVVLVTGNPVCPGPILYRELWRPGILGLAAVRRSPIFRKLLFGTVNPSGKLPITFVKSESDLPHPRVFGLSDEWKNGRPEHWTNERRMTTFPADLTEGSRFGYKWMDSEKKSPLFAFGFGLSYTTFEYSALKIDTAKKSATFALRNTGRRAGTEIAQVYVQLPSAAGEDFRRLAGWQRVALQPGEKKVITVSVEPLSVASFNEERDDWQWLPGQYQVSVGSSSRDLPLKQNVTW